MKDNIGFILTFTAMMVAIMVLHGCSRLDKKDSAIESWEVKLQASEGECTVSVYANTEGTQTDNTMTLDNIKGAGT